MRAEIYQRQKVCPLCGSEMRNRAKVGLARDKKPGYLLALAKNLEVPFDEIVEQLKDWECVACNCIYLDPRLSNEVLGSLYQDAAPIHNAGWSAFTQKLLGVSDKQSFLEDLKRFLKLQGFEYRSYLEVGCPFTGLALSIVDQSRIRRGFLNGIKSDNKYPSTKKSRILRHSDRLQQLWQRLLAVYFRLWLFTRDFIRFAHRSDDLKDVSPRKLYFLGEYSGTRWSIGCRSFGSSCYRMSSSTLGTTSLSIGQVRDLPDGYFGLAGIFNTLDHSDSPLDLLQLVARKSEYVIVTVHPLNDAHLQHSFAFSSDTMTRICEKLNLDCNDISHQVEKTPHFLTYIINRRRDA